LRLTGILVLVTGVCCWLPSIKCFYVAYTGYKNNKGGGIVYLNNREKKGTKFSE
jgi:hypothetical protein